MPVVSTLAIAGLSVRALAEAAASDGLGVIALDLFGDIDTCAVAQRWFGIGAQAGPQIDAQRLLSALALLARQGDVSGWVAGSGFDGRADLLAHGAALLPLIGTPPEVVAGLRDPARFFAWLAAHDIDHPPVQLASAAAPGALPPALANLALPPALANLALPPALTHDSWPPQLANGATWLRKDLHACGGGHIRRVLPGAPLAGAADPVPGPGAYLQREMPGQPMSATFIADGHRAQLLGVNQQIVCPQGAAPFVFGGVLGPVPVAAGVLRRLQHILDALAAGWGLRGLASLDFLCDGEHLLVLEVNPRPSASTALYARWRPMAAHLLACQHGVLPSAPAPGAQLPVQLQVQGNAIVFARQALRLTAEQAQWLAGLPETHDLPAAGQQFSAGDPLCSVGAQAASAAEVLARLAQRRTALCQTLESG